MPFLELIEVRKAYPGVVALDGVTLAVSEGEVIGLIGENGAGKSTLMKVLGGIVAPDAGTIRVDSADKRALTVQEALAAGIAFVHQELNLFENLDVAANVFIGREPLYGGPLKLVDRRRLNQLVEPLLERIGADFRPDALVAELSLAQRQLVEIVKALSLSSRVVIMDEPTSSLTIQETDRLMGIIAALKAQGISVIFISHRLNELEQCADRVVVLRDGRVVGLLERGEITHERMIPLMIGRDLKSLYVPPSAPPGENALEMVEVRTSSYPDQPVSLAIRHGEILGLAGLVGSGRTELARAVFGIDRLLGGSIRLDGSTLEVSDPRSAINKGIYLIPEDRKRAGLVIDEPIAQNISLPNLEAFCRARLVVVSAEVENAERQKQKLDIRVADVNSEVRTLSGGNQQKVVLAKWLSMSPRVLIFDEPTRGVDVGAKSEIYEMMRRLADSGVGILMISSDMEEVVGVSDRIAVMHEGRISGFLEREQFSEHNVLQLAVGATPG